MTAKASGIRDGGEATRARTRTRTARCAALLSFDPCASSALRFMRRVGEVRRQHATKAKVPARGQPSQRLRRWLGRAFGLLAMGDGRLR